MVVQGSPVETTAQSTRLASSKSFSSVEHCSVYKHEQGQCLHSCKRRATEQYRCVLRNGGTI